LVALTADPTATTVGRKEHPMGQKPAPAGYHYVYTAYITLKNGRRIYASSYGLKAFAILVRD
jgi:hypothetical protein